MDNALIAGPARLDGGRSFRELGSGKWAGERFMAALSAGKTITPALLRTNDIIRNEDWVAFDAVLVEEARIRLRAVADLLSAGLVKQIKNGLGKTMLEYEKINDMDDAIVSLDGVTRSENDRLEFETAGLPLPITHKDWYLNLRALRASGETGEPLDTMYARYAGRKVAEKTEDMLFNGSKTFGGRPIYGYLTHPDRNTTSFGAGGDWGQAAKTGEQMLTDIQTGISILEADRQYGPYWVYVGSDASVNLGDDFKAASDKSIRTRLLEVEGISAIRVADKMPAASMVIVQPTADVVEMVEGEPLQTVQWDIHGGFQINFKAFQILVPHIKSDIQGRSGIVHFS